MSAYKKLNQQDVFVTDYVARKNWAASGDDISEYKIETLKGFSSAVYPVSYPNDGHKGRNVTLTYASIEHLFYHGTLNNSVYSGSRDLALQTTLTLSGSRHLRDEVAVISLPRDVIGTHIEPGTFVLYPDDSSDYFLDGFCQDVFSGVDEYIEDTDQLYGSNEIVTEDYIVSESFYVTESIEGEPGQFIDYDQDQQRVEIIDDKNGRLIISGSEEEFTNDLRIVGDIIYNQGLAIITDPEVARYYHTYINPSVKWKSNLPIYTYNVNCKVKSGELNHTLNPTAQSGSFGQLIDEVQVKEFTPYITTLGLYNDANELIATAKTGVPIPKSANIDMTFVVKIDI
jgi:hypothetical protein